MLEAKILNLAITDKGFAIILKPIISDMVLPIFIAPLEAQSIMTGFLGLNQSRPLTHDLIKNILDNCSANILHIVIESVQMDTFFAKIVIEHNGKTVSIDSRPSDAIALSLRAKASIFIEEALLETAGLILEDSDSIINIRDTVPFKYQVFDKDSETGSAHSKANNSDNIESNKIAKIEEIKKLLEIAIKEERYEDAVRYRDELDRLK